MKYVFEQLEARNNPSVIFRGIVESRAYGTVNDISAARSELETVFRSQLSDLCCAKI